MFTRVSPYISCPTLTLTDCLVAVCRWLSSLQTDSDFLVFGSHLFDSEFCSLPLVLDILSLWFRGFWGCLTFSLLEDFYWTLDFGLNSVFGFVDLDFGLWLCLCWRGFGHFSLLYSIVSDCECLCCKERLLFLPFDPQRNAHPVLCCSYLTLLTSNQHPHLCLLCTSGLASLSGWWFTTANFSWYLFLFLLLLRHLPASFEHH